MTDLTDAVERTALLTAALRSAESAREDRLYNDPYAAALVGDAGPALLAEIREATFPADVTRSVPSTPDYNAIRTRFFDDFLQEAAREEGMTQIVLAPSGVDSRSYRMEWPEHIRYFELDRPAVQDFKAERMRGAEPRADLRAVAVDLTADDWETGLIDAGYDPKLPSTWLLEGLLYYLPEQDCRRLLGRVADLCTPGSRIGADMVNGAALTLPSMQALLKVFEGWGCPWVFGSDEPELLFADHDFDVQAVQPGEEGADFGRWPDPVPPRDVVDVRRVFFVHGRRR